MNAKGWHIKIIWGAALFLYLVVLLKLILFKGGAIDLKHVAVQVMETVRRPDLLHTRSMNLVPFRQIAQEWHQLSLHHPASALNLIGNVLAFVPLGIFLSFMPGEKRLFTALLACTLPLLLSLAFEVTQLLTGMGVFDVDDLILNSFGGAAGYMIAGTLAAMGSVVLSLSKVDAGAKKYKET